MAKDGCGRSWPVAAVVSGRLAVTLWLVCDADGDYSYECELAADDDGADLAPDELLWLARWRGVCERWAEADGPGYLEQVRPYLGGVSTAPAAGAGGSPGTPAEALAEAS